MKGEKTSLSSRVYRLPIFLDVRDHIPDISQYDGLRDVLALGMILEFSTVIDRRRYKPHDDFDDAEEQEARLEKATRRYFRVLMKTFCTNYVTKVGSEWVHPSYIYKLSVLKFALALLKYKRNTAGDEHHVAAEKDIYAAIEKHFRADHEDLLPALAHYRANGNGWLFWKGHTIKIFKRDDGNKRWDEGGGELCQLTSDPIYV